MSFHCYQPSTAGNAELNARNARMPEFPCQHRGLQHAMSVMRSLDRAIVELALVSFYNSEPSV
jgi:hypothetical protein